ncbi:multiple epidermal growth factor-like domains protein 10 isoform X2 [Mercenaria mercenaria]|uniref:multiple epidermal growth factor-like domains protein 10 isoform X2 n=1 Tax=Mercenaria mercenaria TaxID=6596 RepID=UPI00234FAB06|nr:multiple epidermal growth factor-like domains protein 10 isoform X2 [Mercenaria mercenaria]
MEVIYIRIYGFLLALACCSSGLDALCSPTFAGIKRFGTDCRYACHCMNNEQCDKNTGNCDSGCDFEWVGPGCQYKNIAFVQTSRHMDNKQPPAFADGANDHNLSTCSFTDTPDSAQRRTVAPWWTVWLPFYAPVRQLTFTTKVEYLSHFPRFNLTVQNMSRSDSELKVYSSIGVLCYQQDYSVPTDKTVKIKCTGTPVGNQIRLQLANTSTQLVLCDFRVYGECKDRTWGTPCANDCGLCETFSQCDVITGHCPTGCDPGYKTPVCNTECENGKYGKNCSYTCSGNCKDNVACEKKDGSCKNGCTPGYTGDKCDKVCPVGNYGHKCKENCSPNCAGGEGNCDKVYGTCTVGCSPGWNGRTCQEACPTGHWGVNCVNPCTNCLSGTCRNTDGLCFGGCMSGLKDTPFCDEDCEDGKYGMNCQEICNENCNGICNKTDGSCQGCKTGWHGYNCSIACSKGTWGESCVRTCGKCLNGSCDRFDGACIGNCQPGYKLKLYCDEECETGRYGNNCTGQCKPACNDISLCRKSDGYCVTGSATAITAVIAGVGSALIVVIIFGVLTILWYLRRKRNGSSENNRTTGPTYGMAMTDLRDKTKCIDVKTDEGTDDAYDTIEGRNDEHQYQQPDEKLRY